MFKKTNYVVGCIFEDKEKILLEKRYDDEDNYAGFWAFPMGHKRFYETKKGALKREMKEELNIKLKRKDLKFLGKFKDIDPTSKNKYISYIYSCIYPKNKIKKSYEQERLQWLTLNQAEKMNIPAVIKKVILKFKKQRHLSKNPR